MHLYLQLRMPCAVKLLLPNAKGIRAYQVITLTHPALINSTRLGKKIK